MLKSKDLRMLKVWPKQRSESLFCNSSLEQA